MPTLAIISDIHANLPALEAVLEHIDGEDGIRAIYQLGDLVGYAPWPNETVALIRERGIPGIGGNYDTTVAARHEHCGCAYEDPVQEALSHSSYSWTLDHVTDETRSFLGRLPFRIDLRPEGGHASGPRVVLVHGTPTLNTLYWREDRGDAFCRKMIQAAVARSGDVIVFGHTHMPWHRTLDGVHLINAGSVGRPKDEDWRACYLLLELGDEVRPTFVRVEYDLRRAVAGIRASALPDEFAVFLETGGAPGH